MAAYQIVCTVQTGCTAAGHIIAVGLGGASSGRMTVGEVYTAIDGGNTFYTSGGGRTASVTKWRCGCGQGTLRSASDATTANNLDQLPMCS